MTEVTLCTETGADDDIEPWAEVAVAQAKSPCMAVQAEATDAAPACSTWAGTSSSVRKLYLLQVPGSDQILALTRREPRQLQPASIACRAGAKPVRR